MIPSSQALEAIKREVDKESQDLVSKEKELRSAEMGLAERKRHYDIEQAAVNKLKEDIRQIKSRMSQHERELTSIEANLARFLKK